MRLALLGSLRTQPLPLSGPYDADPEAGERGRPAGAEAGERGRPAGAGWMTTEKCRSATPQPEASATVRTATLITKVCRKQVKVFKNVKTRRPL